MTNPSNTPSPNQQNHADAAHDSVDPATQPQSDMFGGDPHGVEALCETLSEYMDPEHIDTVRRAYAVGAEAHSTQFRRSGEAYITHPVAVAHILANMHMDWQTVSAAILHDVLEDTDMEKAEMAEAFGETVADLVDGVTKLTKLKDKSKLRQQAENFSKMLLAMNQDIRVILIKLADRLHNMRTMGALPREKQQRKSMETIEIYAPIANRLGMNAIRIELEDLAFSYIHPLRYASIKSALDRTRSHRDELIDIVCEEIREALAEQGIVATVEGRNKHLYGIYSKMRKKIHQKQKDGQKHRREDMLRLVNDLFGVRIVVDDLYDCYRALGVAHTHYRPMIWRFKDYIAIPKSNGYQAIHTGFIGPKGKPFELQIRTREMDIHAQSGIASHWAYKTDSEASAAQARANKWLRNLIEMQQMSGDSVEFLQEAKVDLFPDEVYLFSPRGDIFQLPKGATAVDFAYAIHTEAGNRCYGVRIDGKRSLLRTPLISGQTVDVLLDENAHPDPTWLQFVVTSKARSQIRNYTKNLQHGDAVRMGKRMLGSALAIHDVTIKDLEDEVIASVLKDISLESLDDLYVAIGTGNRLAPLIAKRFVDKYSDDDMPPTSKRQYLRNLFKSRLAANQNKKAPPIEIIGTEGMVLSVGKCCCPIPGDPIVGFMGNERGLVIHHSKCRTLRSVSKQPERWLDAQWSATSTRSYSAKLVIQASNQRGVLGTIGSAVSDAEADVENIQIQERERTRSVITLQVAVRDRKHLAEVMRTIKNGSSIKSVIRQKG